ncbi:MAG: GNAT family N-acetyltransferase [Hyphomicrobiaceae bacterium]
MPEVRLETHRLTLRPVALSDADALFPLINNWAVAQWLGVVPWPYTMADMEHFLGTIAAPRKSSRFPVFAICREGTQIGLIEYGRAPASGEALHHETQLGYWLGEPYWGHGYATEAASALISYAFDVSETASIPSGVFDGNAASLRVQEKLGFEAVDTVMRMCRPHGKELPLIRTRLARERFRPLAD